MFIVIESQKTNDTTMALLTNQYEEQAAAESAYHQALAAAAISSVKCHSAAILDDRLNVLKCQTYDH